jgi:hypothetical protein
VQQELFSTANQHPGPVEQQLLRQVADIIRRCEDDLLSSFEPSNLFVPPLSDRRSSDTSTISDRASLIQTPAPEPRRDSEMAIQSSRATESAASGMPVVRHEYQQSSPEPPVQFRSTPWDVAPAQTPSSEWIDWDAIFPSAPAESGCNAAPPFFSVPMWTR